MKISKNQRIREGYSKNWGVFDYPIAQKDIGIAYQKLNGHVPEKGFFSNKKCKEIFYILDGKGMLATKDNKFDLEKGDIYVAAAGECHNLTGDNLEFITITTPNWYPEQCETVDK